MSQEAKVCGMCMLRPQINIGVFYIKATSKTQHKAAEATEGMTDSEHDWLFSSFRLLFSLPLSLNL